MVLGTHYAPFAAINRRKTVSPDQTLISAPLRALELAFKEADVRKVEAYRRGLLPEHPTLIEHGPIRILLSSSPCPRSLHKYAEKLAAYNVTHVVRVSEPTYDADTLRQFGLCVHDWPFADGDAPEDPIIHKWLDLLEHVFHINEYCKTNVLPSPLSDISADFGSPRVDNAKEQIDVVPKETVAIHCAAGLGRAPVLVAIALVYLKMDPFEAVGWIRALRRGAINGRQMAFVESYSRRPPPTPVKTPKRRSRSSSLVGALWPSFKATRAFRPRSPQTATQGNVTDPPRRYSNCSASNSSDV